MPVNPYFQNVSNRSEQDLMESQVIEVIQMYGAEALYIPRENFELDPILKEPKKTVFKRSFPIEVLLPDYTELGTDLNIMSRFGFRTQQTTTILFSKKRFLELGTGRIRPKESDLIYIGDPENPERSFLNAFWEVNYVDHDKPSWQLGREFTFKLTCELFNASYEKFQTAVPGLDQMNADNAFEVATGINSDVGEAKQDLLKFDRQNPFAEL
jgi:hypothetical protein